MRAEVNRSIELDELKKMKTSFEDAARGVEQAVQTEISQTSSDLDRAWQDNPSSFDQGITPGLYDPLGTPVPEYKRPNKNWRLKRGATPQWYKQRHGVRTRAQSGAARVARFRPPGRQA